MKGVQDQTHAHILLPLVMLFKGNCAQYASRRDVQDVCVSVTPHNEQQSKCPYGPFGPTKLHCILEGFMGNCSCKHQVLSLLLSQPAIKMQNLSTI
jgi:hypothetical protein